MKSDVMPWPKMMLQATFINGVAVDQAQACVFSWTNQYQFLHGSRTEVFHGYERNLRNLKRACNRRGPAFRNAFITEYYTALLTR